MGLRGIPLQGQLTARGGWLGARSTAFVMDANPVETSIAGCVLVALFVGPGSFVPGSDLCVGRSIQRSSLAGDMFGGRIRFDQPDLPSSAVTAQTYPTPQL